MNKTYNKHIIIIGTARSGTSWLSETMAQPFRYRMLFEPEQETRTEKGYLLCDRLITEGTKSEEAIKYLHKIFQNRVDCDWIAQNSNRKFKLHLWPFIPKMFIIKFVRANLLGNFLNANFGIPVIHLIRSPYDTIKSQLKVDFEWLTDLSIFASQAELVDSLIQLYKFDLLNWKNLSKIEKLSVRWCIENVLPFEYFNIKDDNYILLKYENVVEDQNIYIELCKRLGVEYVDNLDEIYRKPSSKTHPSVNSITKETSFGPWKKNDLNEINKILDIFRCSFYPRL